MRVAVLITAGGLGLLAASAPARATTVYFYIDPMTLEQRSVKVDLDGPDRAFLCMLPPATSGCQQVPLRRRQRG